MDLNRIHQIVLESMKEAVYVRDLEMNILYINPASEQLTGWSLEEAKGKKCYEVFGDEHARCKDVCPAETAMAEGVHLLHHEGSLKTRTGEILEMQVSISPVSGEEKVAGAVLVMKDMTGLKEIARTRAKTIVALQTEIQKRKRAEEKPKESDSQKQAILNGIKTNLAFVDEKLEILWVNKAASDSVGKLPSQMIGHRCHEFWADPDKPCDGCPTAKAFKTKTSEHMTIVTPDGRVWDEKGEPVFDDDGRLIGVVEIAQDITERKKAEEAVRESQEMLQIVLDTIPAGVFWKDCDLVYRGANRTWLGAAGLNSSQEVIGKTDYDLPWEKDQSNSYRETDRRITESGIPEYNIIEPYTQADGSLTWAKTNKVPLRDVEGNVVGILGTYEDITERIRAEDALRLSEERYRLLVENLNDAIFSVNMKGEITYVSQAIERMSRYKVEELVGFPFQRFVHPDDLPALMERYQKTIEGEIVPQEYRLVDKDGREIHIRTSIRPVYKSGRVVGLTGVMADVTDRKQWEEALRSSESTLRAILAASPVGIFLTRDRKINWANDAWLKMFGFETHHEYMDQPTSLMHPSQEDYERIRKILYDDIEQGRICEAEASLRRRDGTLFDAQMRINLLDPSDGSKGIISTISDISGRKKAEQALRASEERLQLVLREMPILMDAFDRDGNIVFWNKECERVTGYSAEEAIGNVKIWERMYPDSDYRNYVRNTVEKNAGDFREVEFEITCKDGNRRTILWSNISTTIPIPGWASWAIGLDITPRKKADEALRESEQRLSQIINFLPDATLAVDREGRVIAWNRAIEEMTGVPAEEMVGKGDHEYALPFYGNRRPILLDLVLTSNDEMRQTYSLFSANKQVLTVETDTATPLGKKVVLWAKAAPLYDMRGDIVGAIETIRDITDRKHAAEALRESEEKYRILVENANEGVFVAQDAVFKFLNPRTAAIVGYSEEELISKPFVEFIHPDDREMVLQSHFRRLGGEDLPGRYPFRILTKDGNSKWVEIDAVSIQWEGRPAALALMTDVTTRKCAEEALKESEQWHRSIVEESFDGIFVQQGSKIVYANRVLYEMLGYSEGELEGIDHWGIYHPDYQQAVRERAMARMRGETLPHQFDVVLERKDGSHFEGETDARAVTVKGEPGVRVWVRDVSKRKRLEEVQRRLATAIEQAGEVIVMTDSLGNVEYVNPAHERITGYTREEVIGSPTPLFKEHELDPELRREFSDSMEKGRVWSGRIAGRRKDNTLCEMDVTVAPVRDFSGRIVSRVSVERDVTQEVRLQQQLLQAQKMEAIGTLAGGIAHDFNNLLTIVMGFSELILAEKDQKDPEYADLEKIFHAAHNGAELVKRLLMFSRKSEPKLVPMNLNKQIVQVEKLLRRTIPRMIDMQLELSPDLPEIHADSSQIEQVLMNLAVNARDAMPDVGKLTVRTAMATLGEEYCGLNAGVNPGEYVVLEVSDTGHGMDKETVEHIFEPFFTTKEMGRGTGLGLAMVYGIVKQHNGHITVYSEVGKGTTFRVYLPAIPSDVEPEVADSGIMPAFGTETVLLVDDEEFVRELGARILTKHGYTVLRAKNGKEALDIFNKERSQISLVILDLIMPEMGGTECLNELLKIDPKVRVLVASGFSGDAPVKETIQIGAKGFVSKPFRVKELLRDVRKVLDQAERLPE